MKRIFLIPLLAVMALCCQGQTTITIDPDSLIGTLGTQFQPGVFYVPKTQAAQTDFLSNGIRQNSIRLNIIEGALNNTSNLNDCLAYLDNVSSILQSLANKTDNLLFIFEKMPAWLSSSSDGSPASTPGWFVLNTKPPASWIDWNNMVAGVVDRIVNGYGITNAQFEIWNEPDLGSWTGSKSEYFALFQNTYDAIKSVNGNLPIGGPATNHWGKNIGHQHPYGYLTPQYADSSLVGELIDSTLAWNKPLDFISWHDFGIVHQTNQNAIDYIQQKYASQGMATPKLMVSEWNTPSILRDTPLQQSFFVKNLMEMAKTDLDYNMVAAWQDFDQTSNEFHGDYGLLTYGGIHKPAYKGILLAEQFKRELAYHTSTTPSDFLAAVINDTLNILMVNYTPLPIVEALNQTLFTGNFNAYQLDSLGYIDLVTNDLSVLDSIYQGLLLIPNSNLINTAINDAIPTYQHYDSLQSGNRQFQLQVDGITSTYPGVCYRVDSSNNNNQFAYEALIAQGQTQAQAIANLTSNQFLQGSPVDLINGQLNVSMQPNAIAFYQFEIPEIVFVEEAMVPTSVTAYPNPTHDKIFLQTTSKPLGQIEIVNLTGTVLSSMTSKASEADVDLTPYAKGIYFLRLPDLQQTLKVVRE